MKYWLSLFFRQHSVLIQKLVGFIIPIKISYVYLFPNFIWLWTLYQYLHTSTFWQGVTATIMQVLVISILCFTSSLVTYPEVIVTAVNTTQRALTVNFVNRISIDIPATRLTIRAHANVSGLVWWNLRTMRPLDFYKKWQNHFCSEFSLMTIKLCTC